VLNERSSLCAVQDGASSPPPKTLILSWIQRVAFLFDLMAAAEFDPEEGVIMQV